VTGGEDPLAAAGCSPKGENPLAATGRSPKGENPLAATGRSPNISLEKLGVRFAFDRQRRPVTPMAARIRRRCTHSWALRDVDLEIRGGQGIALVGANGAGKTTLLRVLAGVLPADAGTAVMDGRVGSLLSIQAGVTGLLTGRENAHLLGVLTGQSRSGARAALDDVRDRSGLGEAFDRPVASYSQGMRARLGFAVVDRLDPDILLLDEVHEALDHDFRNVMEERARRIIHKGGIVVAAGHDHAELSRLCDRALVLREGQVAESGALAELGTFEHH
jgi:lipopolysaccharide transport system ATP-binding protein